MKKFLLSTVALLGATAGALAADLPSRRAPAPYVAVPVFTWTGFYVGVNAGYGFSDSNNNNNVFGFGNPIAVGPVVSQPIVPLGGGTFGFGGNGNNGNRDGFIGGGQIGYNYQFGNIVVGIEADAQYADFGNNRNVNVNGLATAIGTNGAFAPNLTAPVLGSGGNVQFFNTGLFGNNGTEWFGTVRGRLGYAIDRLLVYGTGGLAFTDGGNNNNNGVFGTTTFPAGFFRTPGAAAAGAFYANNTFGLSRRMDDIGYAVGGGVEYAFTPNLSAKIEGLYVNFGTSGGNGAGGGVVGVTNLGVPVISATGAGTGRRDVDFGVVRAGLNYKFNLF